MTPGEKRQLLGELSRIQAEVPAVVVTVERGNAALAAAQSRVDEIEAMLTADEVKRTPKADLEA